MRYICMDGHRMSGAGGICIGKEDSEGEQWDPLRGGYMIYLWMVTGGVGLVEYVGKENSKEE